MQDYVKKKKKLMQDFFINDDMFVTEIESYISLRNGSKYQTIMTQLQT